MPAQNAQAMFNVKQLIRSSNYQAKDNYQSRNKLRKKKKKKRVVLSEGKNSNRK